MAKLPRVKMELLKESFDWLTEDDVIDILRGLEVKNRRRRRRGDSGAGAGTILMSPDPVAIFDNVAAGTTIATFLVTGGFGTYTYSLSDPSGQFRIIGNQLQTQTTLVAGMFPITVTASNGLGDTPTFSTIISVSHATSYVPTYELLGF